MIAEFCEKLNARRQPIAEVPGLFDQTMKAFLEQISAIEHDKAFDTAQRIACLGLFFPKQRDAFLARAVAREEWVTSNSQNVSDSHTPEPRIAMIELLLRQCNNVHVLNQGLVVLSQSASSPQIMKLYSVRIDQVELRQDASDTITSSCQQVRAAIQDPTLSCSDFIDAICKCRIDCTFIQNSPDVWFHLAQYPFQDYCKSEDMRKKLWFVNHAFPAARTHFLLDVSHQIQRADHTKDTSEGAEPGVSHLHSAAICALIDREPSLDVLDEANGSISIAMETSVTCVTCRTQMQDVIAFIGCRQHELLIAESKELIETIAPSRLSLRLATATKLHDEQTLAAWNNQNEYHSMTGNADSEAEISEGEEPDETAPVEGDNAQDHQADSTAEFKAEGVMPLTIAQEWTHDDQDAAGDEDDQDNASTGVDNNNDDQDDESEDDELRSDYESDDAGDKDEDDGDMERFDASKSDDDVQSQTRQSDSRTNRKRKLSNSEDTYSESPSSSDDDETDSDLESEVSDTDSYAQRAKARKRARVNSNKQDTELARRKLFDAWVEYACTHITGSEVPAQTVRDHYAAYAKKIQPNIALFSKQDFPSMMAEYGFVRRTTSERKLYCNLALNLTSTMAILNDS